MSNCALNEKQRQAMQAFLESNCNSQGFALYLGIVQAYLRGMIDLGVKCKAIEEIAYLETDKPEECSVNLYNYIRDVYNGRVPALSLKDCLS